MDFKNVNPKDYRFNLDLHKSMFFIDMLKDTYEFTLKGDGIEIFKKIKNGISEPITRKELIYSIQVEMAEKYRSTPYRAMKDIAISGNHNIVHLWSGFKDFKDPSKEQTEERKLHVHQQNVKLLIIIFYHLFGDIDSIHKTIDNMVYLEKYLKRQAVIVPEQPPKKVIVESAPQKKPEFGGWEEDEEEEEEKVTEEELKMESMRLLRKQMESAHLGENKKQDEEEVNELGENKKLVLKNALEKECLSARTELFRPAWRPPR